MTVIKSEYPFSYTGRSQKWICPADGTYQLDAYGASGGDVPDEDTYRSRGGNGAHVKGEITLNKNDVLYVNVGQEGITLPKGTQYEATLTTFYTGGRAWNGGGYALWCKGAYADSGFSSDYSASAVKDPLCGGGGATDFSLDFDSDLTKWNTTSHLKTRILVAGAGGGAMYYSGEHGYANGGDGGVWEGEDGGGDDMGFGGGMNHGGYGGVAYCGFDKRYYNASQFAIGFDGRNAGFSGSEGVFGEGGYYWDITEGNGNGGAGWFGGGAGGQGAANGGGGGGSSYAWTDEEYVTEKQYSYTHIV